MSNIIDKIQLSGVTYDIGGSGGITSGEVQTMIDESISGKTNQSDFTAHTSNTSIHVTTAQTAAWDAKSNFSGSYNDLTDKPTIPTVPTSNTAFTNDAGYITDSALEDYATESYVTNGLDGKQDTLESGVNIKTVNNYSLLGSGNINIGGSGGNNVVELTQSEYDALDPKDPSAFYIITDAEGGDLANYMTSAQTTSAIAQAVSGKTDNSDFTGHTADTTVHVTAQDKTNWNAKSNFSGDYNDLTNKLSAGTNITIVDNVISATGGGGGKAIEAGRGISVTTGETADTVSFNLPIYSGTGEGSIIGGFSGNTASGKYSFALGGRYESMFDYQYCRATGKGAISFGGTASGQGAFSCGENPQALGFFSVAFGDATKAIGVESFVIGRNTTANTFVSFAQGKYTKTTNEAEVALGEYNNSVSGSTTFGDSGNTLFSVGNGTANNARHNAFEIRQNGDIYCSDGTNDVKLQDTITATAANTTALGGLKLVKLSQSEYDGLATKDNSTLYVIVN